MTIEERGINYAEERCGRLDYATGQQSYVKGATDQQKIFIEKLKDVMNRLTLDTKDKAEIIKAMEE